MTTTYIPPSLKINDDIIISTQDGLITISEINEDKLNPFFVEIKYIDWLEIEKFISIYNNNINQ